MRKLGRLLKLWQTRTRAHACTHTHTHQWRRKERRKRRRRRSRRKRKQWLDMVTMWVNITDFNFLNLFKINLTVFILLLGFLWGFWNSDLLYFIICEKVLAFIQIFLLPHCLSFFWNSNYGYSNHLVLFYNSDASVCFSLFFPLCVLVWIILLNYLQIYWFFPVLYPSCW